MIEPFIPRAFAPLIQKFTREITFTPGVTRRQLQNILASQSGSKLIALFERVPNGF